MGTVEDEIKPLGEASSQTAIEQLLPFERLLSEISAGLILASPATVQQHLRAGLRRLAEFFDVDRTVLWEQSADHQELLERESYTRPGTRLDLREGPARMNLPWWRLRMLRGELIRFSTLTDLPPEASHVRAFAERVGLRSYLSVPISIQSKHRHHLVLASFRQERVWPDALIPRLRLLGEMFAGALERVRIEQALRQSELRYREVFELTSDCIFLLDVTPDLRFVVTRFNPAEEQTVGLYGVEGRFLDELLPQSLTRTLYANFRRCIESGASFSYEEALPLPIGVRYFHTTLIPVKDATGRTHRIVGIAHHITERVEAEQTAHLLADASRILAESLDYQTTLAQVARLAVPVLADWCVVDILEHGTCHRIAGAHVDPSKELLLQVLAERYPVDAVASQPASQVLRTGQALLLANTPEDVLRAHTRDAAHATLIRMLGCLSLMAVPLMARGRMLGVLTLVSSQPGRHYGPTALHHAQDLAHRIGLALDNARLYREAQESIRLRDEFLSIASHELRTPITSLNLATQALLDPQLQPSPEKLHRTLRLVRRQIDRLTRLIEEILTVSRIQGEHLELHREEVDLISVVRAVVARLEGDLARAGCELQLRLDTAGPVIGRWDRSRLDEVVTNLLTNAIKFGAGKLITLELEAVGDVARLIVSDRGIGIAPERLPHIFERFERAVSSKHYGGLGLGLYIVREIVEALGGSVRAESYLGFGSTFTVELPLRPWEQAGPHHADVH
ncbi:MAG: ATP-binding protein [Hyalangium sp.]|uniref:sensor histidine kinase n=1 Tax=Hyalangium sp. TaxID=2028555 RepID=UPI00389A9FBD